MNDCSVHVPTVKDTPRVLAISNARKIRERRVSSGCSVAITEGGEEIILQEEEVVEITQEPVAEELPPPFWRSCCFELDKRFVVFMSQLLISLLIMSFSMYQLSGEQGTCEGSAPYLALISTTVGYWLPQPKM